MLHTCALKGVLKNIAICLSVHIRYNCYWFYQAIVLGFRVLDWINLRKPNKFFILKWNIKTALNFPIDHGSGQTEGIDGQQRSGTDIVIVDESPAAFSSEAGRLHGDLLMCPIGTVSSAVQRRDTRKGGMEGRSIPFSAFWLRSSVVSVLISLISDTRLIEPHDINLIFFGCECICQLAARTCLRRLSIALRLWQAQPSSSKNQITKIWITYSRAILCVYVENSVRVYICCKLYESVYVENSMSVYMLETEWVCMLEILCMLKSLWGYVCWKLYECVCMLKTLWVCACWKFYECVHVENSMKVCMLNSLWVCVCWKLYEDVGIL
jgi:hypothetical protein